MLELVKDALRVSGNDLDTEIQHLIDAAKADLKSAGVSEGKINDDDPLIKQAIIVYCKAYFGYDDMGERFAEAYENFKKHLAVALEYTGGAEL